MGSVSSSSIGNSGSSAGGSLPSAAAGSGVGSVDFDVETIKHHKLTFHLWVS